MRLLYNPAHAQNPHLPAGLNPQGPYDLLYKSAANNLLWPDRQGRVLGWLAATGQPLHRALDAGCGDGKNAVALAKLGVKVLGFDVSSAALRGAVHRVSSEPNGPLIRLRRQSAEGFVTSAGGPIYDALVSYGLFHCLAPAFRHRVHTLLQARVRSGGLVAFCSLTSSIPLPPEHGTGAIVLPSAGECTAMFTEGWSILHCETGHIVESHRPLVGPHIHSAVWILAKRLA